MPVSPYVNLDVQIQRVGDRYQASHDGPGGQASVTFTLPFSSQDLEIFVLRMGRTRTATRRIDSPEITAAKSLGDGLFSALFAGDARALLRGSLDEARRQGVGVRIRLRLAQTPELSDLPWEYLYNAPLNRFLSLATETPVVRYLDLPEEIRPLRVAPPICALVMISAPHDYPRLDVDREWAEVQTALRDAVLRGLVSLTRVDDATLPALQRCLRQGVYHIFHFVGHGGFDPATQDGVLVCEDEQGRGRLVSGQDLAMILHNHRSLRLAVLNACEGARASRVDPFAGVAQSLVQQGLSAVVAMQFDITDEASIVFAREFYGALADGYPVDAAVVESRTAIHAQQGGLEWGTPVLYMRAPDGRIFDVETPPAVTPLLGHQATLEPAAPAFVPVASAPSADGGWIPRLAWIQAIGLWILAIVVAVIRDNASEIVRAPSHSLAPVFIVGGVVGAAAGIALGALSLRAKRWFGVACGWGLNPLLGFIVVPLLEAAYVRDATINRSFVLPAVLATVASILLSSRARQR